MKELVIETTLTDNASRDVLISVLGQLSDGLWCNSAVMRHYWPFADIETRNGQVCIIIACPSSTNPYSDPFEENSIWNNWFVRADKLSGNPTLIKEFFAKKIKEIVKANAHKYNWPMINRRITKHNKTPIDYMASYDKANGYRKLLVSEVYTVYEALTK